MPPPEGAELPVIVQFATRSVAEVPIPPPLVPAELPLIVLFTMLESRLTPIGPGETEIPPPLVPAELPLMVLLATVSKVRAARIPPELPLMVQSVIVMYARPPKKFGAATTPPAELRLTVLLRIVAVTAPNSPVLLEIPDPSLSLTLLFTTVRLAQFSIPPTAMPLMTQFLTVNVPPL